MNLFLVNKARALFAFLFGVGFYFQLAKAERYGYRMEGKFARRMLTLLLIGILHAYLIWTGDILRSYALSGLALLLVYRRPSKFLFLLAIAFSVLLPGLSVLFSHHFPFTILTDDLKVQMYRGFIGKEYSSFFRANLLRDLATSWDPYAVSFFLLPVFGNFLFGYLAARINLFTTLIANRALLHRCLLFSFVTGFICSNSFIKLASRIFGFKADDLPSVWRDIYSFLNCFGNECTAFFLLCFIVRVYQVPVLQKKLAILSYAGRMTLTNYIMQSLFGVWFFYGVGLGFISHYGPATAFLIGLGYFMIQLGYSRLWLRYFSMGPVEYIWRSLIDGRWQRIRRERDVAALSSSGQDLYPYIDKRMSE